MGGATAMAAPAVVVIPVPCSVSALAGAVGGAPANAILSLKSGCRYQLTASLPKVTSNLTIQGNGDTLIRAGSLDITALTVSGAQVAINRLTMSGFSGGKGSPAALDNDGGAVTITKSRFIHNDGGEGGAIQNESAGRLDVSSTTFTSNGAEYGGAVANEDTSTATLTSDTFQGNTAAESGGAIYIAAGMVTVQGTGASAGAATSFTGNTAAGDYGGAIYNEGGTLIANYAIFTDNSAPDYGGAIEDDDGSSRVSDSGFTGNEAEYGGGLEADALLSLTGDTFTRNSSYDGGGIYVYGGATTLDKTVVFGNRARDEGGGIYRNGGSVSLTNKSLVLFNRPDNCSGFSC
jgi:predicted outer membrane repeat protein